MKRWATVYLNTDGYELDRYEFFWRWHARRWTKQTAGTVIRL